MKCLDITVDFVEGVTAVVKRSEAVTISGRRADTVLWRNGERLIAYAIEQQANGVDISKSCKVHKRRPSLFKKSHLCEFAGATNQLAQHNTLYRVCQRTAEI